ncbi:hypothetical protein PGTUg99_036051 [Puccinia graminis f. sp. tritici]|uniref:Uncharacterized protein n=1 Tax=Puccinia graminis f. sp. tritici TaxID=56615 RepID=A0A5B0MHH6_PUCGR|nr:hypothetical protein PGTUg99_036051 [Puccinia graminis f. sp. tritici]
MWLKLHNLSKSEGHLSELKEKLKVEADLARQATLQRQIEGREYQRGGTQTSSSEGIPSDELV